MVILENNSLDLHPPNTVGSDCQEGKADYFVKWNYKNGCLSI